MFFLFYIPLSFLQKGRGTMFIIVVIFLLHIQLFLHVVHNVDLVIIHNIKRIRAVKQKLNTRSTNKKRKGTIKSILRCIFSSRM